MTTDDSAATTRESGQFDEKAADVVLRLALKPPSSVERRLAVMAGGAWAVLVATFFIDQVFLTFALPVAMLVGAVAGAVHPRSPLRATLAVVLACLLLCVAESGGSVDYFVLAYFVCLPVLGPALWIGAWASAVAVRHLRTRHLRSSC